MEFLHESVLLEESIEGLNIKENGIYLDGTLGGAGHSKHILKKLKNGLLIGIDQDENAIKKSKEILSEIGNNFKLFHFNYKDFKKALNETGVEKVDGILLDLGVSSHQFDTGDRGFSYNYDAKLDMRMDKRNKLTAYDIVNTYTKDEITKILKEYADERWGDRIAEFIISERKDQPIETTFQLVEVIKKAIPRKARQDKGHPAKKTFQALRIETNDEINILKKTLGDMINSLNPGGRIAVITFHSLEDRIVKETFKYFFQDCICPREFPVCKCDKKREINIITRKPIIASVKELERNNRAHSAKLRVAEKI